MTNLYDFLREIRRRSTMGPYNLKSVPISPDELAWIDQFLTSPDIELHFKATKVPDTPTEENRFAYHYGMKGDPVDIFTLLTEAAKLNAKFAQVLKAAAQFCEDNVTHEPPAQDEPTWNFSTN